MGKRGPESFGRVGKKKARSGKVTEAGPNPAEFLGADAARQASAEAWLDTAVRSWLPAAFAAPGSLPATEPSAEAAHLLAQILRNRRHDPWLLDMLGAHRSAELSKAWTALARSAALNAEDSPAAALEQARVSERWFLRQGIPGGAARAGIEELYALQRAQRGAECLAREAELSRGSHADYGWIEAQMQMERAICSLMTGDLGKAREAIDGAARAADAFGYEMLQLRAAGIRATISTELGDGRAAWREHMVGLRRFWSGEYPPRRAHQFYNDMSRLAATSGLPHTACTAKQEAVEMISLVHDPAMEAMGRYLLASMAANLGSAPEAAAEFKKAENLFASLAPTAENTAFRLYSELGLVEVEAQGGELDRPLQRLSRIRALPEAMDNALVALRYYQSAGDLHLRRGEWDAAERSLLAARGAAAESRASLKDQRSREIWAKANEAVYRESVDLYYRGRADPARAWQVWREYRGAAPKGAIFVSYTQLADGLVIWISQGGAVQSVWSSINAGALGAEAAALRGACANPNSPSAVTRMYGSLLYDKLLKPIAARVAPGSTILIEPDGATAGVPWEALVSPDGTYAADRYQFIVTESGAGMRSSGGPASGKIGPETRALIIGSSTADQSLAPLPDALREAHAVADAFRSSTLLLGRDATLANIRRLLPKAELLHFAGHGVAEGGGSLMIAGGPGQAAARLNAASLSGMGPLACRMAVLSACSTAGDPDENAWTPDTLVREFHRLGVPWVLASRWNVDSRRTADLMKIFYERLAAGDEIPAAWAAACRALRQRSDTSHPYYWAAFGLSWGV